MAQRPALVADISLVVRWLYLWRSVIDRRWTEARMRRNTKPLLACPNQDRMRSQLLGHPDQALNNSLSMNPMTL